ncbi:MAG: UBP-type zinc finger domain-containing protein [Candidatus Dormibacteraeota bacterium]|nr:UBP-type zinc finger domain-containing protein [Candidatus Dormibacteraeota bacterium]
MESPCAHLASLPEHVDPATPQGCAECLAAGTTWVHLRLCLSCGHVGCCDASEGKHATAHNGSTEHPVIQSFQPGESWRWCYVHEVMLP